ncbi:MAG: hypothetical protein ACE5G1_08305, partial [bacterium]
MKIGYMLLTLVLVAPMNNTLAKNESIAPFEATGDGPRFYIDYSNFQGVDNLTYTEFYIQISYNELQFVKRGNRFVSGYDLEFEVLDEENNVIESYSNTDIFQVDNFSETESMTKARVSMIAFTFEPGVYRIKAAMLDRETRKSAKLHRKFTAHSFKQENLLISDIQFSQKIEVCNEQR